MDTSAITLPGKPECALTAVLVAIDLTAALFMLDKASRFVYDVVKYGTCDKISDHPLKYKTPQLDGDKIFVHMMAEKGYSQYDQLGGLYLFKNQKSVKAVATHDSDDRNGLDAGVF